MLGCLMPAPRNKLQGSAAFYDVDGTLIRANIVHAFAFGEHQGALGKWPPDAATSPHE